MGIDLKVAETVERSLPRTPDEEQHLRSLPWLGSAHSYRPETILGLDMRWWGCPDLRDERSILTSTCLTLELGAWKRQQLTQTSEDLPCQMEGGRRPR